MSITTAPAEAATIRQAFPHWSIRVPLHFDETFVLEDTYWHAWDATRSISLSSVLITERGQPVSAKRIVRQMPAPNRGSPVPLPPDLPGWAISFKTEQPARASRVVSGMVAVRGRILIATVTADDVAWATGTWQSIRFAAEPPPNSPLVITLPPR